MPKKPARAPRTKKKLSDLAPKSSGPKGGLMGINRLVVTKGTISAKP